MHEGQVGDHIVGSEHDDDGAAKPQLHHEGGRCEQRGNERGMTMDLKKDFVRVECDCGCCVLEFGKTEWDDGDVFYNARVLDSRYDHNVNGIIGRIKRAAGVLLGRPVCFNDVIMRAEEFDDLLRRLRALRGGESRVDDVAAENAMLRDVVNAMRICDDDDADGRDCPLYDESEPYSCKMDRVLGELGLCDGR